MKEHWGCTIDCFSFIIMTCTCELLQHQQNQHAHSSNAVCWLLDKMTSTRFETESPHWCISYLFKLWYFKHIRSFPDIWQNTVSILNNMHNPQMSSVKWSPEMMSHIEYIQIYRVDLWYVKQNRFPGFSLFSGTSEKTLGTGITRVYSKLMKSKTQIINYLSTALLIIIAIIIKACIHLNLRRGFIETHESLSCDWHQCFILLSTGEACKLTRFTSSQMTASIWQRQCCET